MSLLTEGKWKGNDLKENEQFSQCLLLHLVWIFLFGFFFYVKGNKSCNAKNLDICFGHSRQKNRTSDLFHMYRYSVMVLFSNLVCPKGNHYIFCNVQKIKTVFDRTFLTGKHDYTCNGTAKSGFSTIQCLLLQRARESPWYIVAIRTVWHFLNNLEKVLQRRQGSTSQHLPTTL